LQRICKESLQTLITSRKNPVSRITLSVVLLQKSSGAKPAQKIDLSVFNKREEEPSGWRIQNKD
jgi:hypothetical protein